MMVMMIIMMMIVRAITIIPLLYILAGMTTTRINLGLTRHPQACAAIPLLGFSRRFRTCSLHWASPGHGRPWQGHHGFTRQPPKCAMGKIPSGGRTLVTTSSKEQMDRIQDPHLKQDPSICSGCHLVVGAVLTSLICLVMIYSICYWVQPYSTNGCYNPNTYIASGYCLCTS